MYFDHGLPLIMDSFAGGGGASTGIEMALGRSPDIAINHNPAALALHEANHRDTLHLSENVYKVDVLDYVRGRHIGLAWFSPDCKHFSKAKGGKPVERNVRDLAWIIPGWIERIQKSGGRVDVVILENVEEFREWGPLIETERGLMPDPEQKGKDFKRWCRKLRSLGGKIQWRELRACDYGAPTIRKRLFVIVRFDGMPIVWPKPSHGKPTDPDVIAGRKLPWRIAAEIIDWSLPCPSIFDTTEEIFDKYGLRAIRPLAGATMSRVARGTSRYVLEAIEPFLVSVAHGYSGGRREYPIGDPYGVVTAGGISHALITPLVTYAQQGGANRSIKKPLHTVAASPKDQNALIAPTLIQIGYGERKGQAPRALNIRAPLGTTVAGGVKHALAVPTLVGCGGRAGQSRPRSGGEPLATTTAKADVCVTAAFLAQHNNDRGTTPNAGRPATEPLSTTTGKAPQGIVAAFMSRQFGTSVGHGMREPTHTATAEVNKSALVTPFITKYYGVEQESGLDEPLHTATGKARFGHVEATVDWPPFTEEVAARARQVADFLRAHGFWDEREFVTVEIDGETFTIVDIGMRMLTPRELFNAQGFPPDYIIDLMFEGKPLPKSSQISCCGNSVSPPMAQALVSANCNHLARVRMAA